MIALLPWRWQVRLMFLLGHSVGHIAKQTRRSMNDVERALGWLA